MRIVIPLDFFFFDSQPKIEVGLKLIELFCMDPSSSHMMHVICVQPHKIKFEFLKILKILKNF